MKSLHRSRPSRSLARVVSILALVASACSAAHRPIDEDDADVHAAQDSDVVIEADADVDAVADAANDGDVIVEPPCVDADGDGHPSVDCGGDDCDDVDPSIYPGAPDACDDGLDTNCDGMDPDWGTIDAPLLVLEHPPTSGNLYTALLWTGDGYLFLWRIYAGDGIYVHGIDDNGKLVGDEVRLRTYENAFDVAWNGSRVGAVWVAGQDADMSVMFQAYDSLGYVLTDAIPVVSSPDIGTDGSVVYGPRIAAAGDDFFVIWSERDRPSGATVYITRVDPEGALRLDPVAVSTYSGGDGPKLDLAWSGSEVMVSWTSDTEEFPEPRTSVYLRSFSFDLEPLGDEHLIANIAYSGTPQILWSGSEFLELWSDADDWWSDEGPVLQSRRDERGDELATVTLGDPLVGYYRYLRPAVWGLDRLTVLWNRSPAEGLEELTMTRFDLDGSRHGASIVVPTDSRPNRLYLVWTGAEYGFIWSEDDQESFGYRVWFQRATFCD